MHSIPEIQNIITQTLVDQEFIRHPKELYEPIHYTMNQGGKRIRPVLTLLACELFGGDIQFALHPALAIEIFHNFTLVHDDIMDNAPLRRGRETVYRKWNQNIAILSGDTMFALAYQYALKTRHDFVPQILEAFNKAAIEVCEGQQLDMNFEQVNVVSIPQYIEMIRLKTAVLIAVSLQIGSIIGNAKTKDQVHIEQFGTLLGIAFQLKDDYLDVYGQEDSFGKQNGGDIVAGKKTFLYLKALEVCDKDVRNNLIAIYNDQKTDPVIKYNKVRSIYDQVGIEKLVNAEMQSYYQRALTALELIDVDRHRKTNLFELASILFDRTY